MSAAHPQKTKPRAIRSSPANVPANTKKLAFRNSTSSNIEKDGNGNKSTTSDGSMQTSQHSRETLRVKRKSRTPYANRKKRNSNLVVSNTEPAVANHCKEKLDLDSIAVNRTPAKSFTESLNEQLHAHLTSTPDNSELPQNKHNRSAQSRTLLNNSVSELSFSSFWNDDQVFEEFNLSDAVASSCKSSDVVMSSEVRGNNEKIICENGACVLDSIPTETDSSTLEFERTSLADKIQITTGDQRHQPNDGTECQRLQSNEGQTFYGLPMKVKEMLSVHRGIDKLYEWQDTCLRLPAIEQRRNLIYSLPTSGGKTLVAEILMMREMLLHNKDVVMILPFVSIVQEKVRTLTQFAVELDFVVEEYAASKGKFPPRKRKKKRALYVTTIEKANSLVNSLIEEQRMDSLGLIVVDELHMLGEGAGRGATLEMCLSKTLFSASHTQVIGMSATLSNISDLQRFLLADIYSDNFRPVELQEFVKVESAVYQVPSSHSSDEIYQAVRHVTHKQIPVVGTCKDQRQIKDPDHLVPLVQEVIPQHSCLIFCATKRNCENVAKLLVEFLPSNLREEKAEERMDLLKALYYQANGLCPVLRCSVPYGIAYHHSGLTMDERKLIEDAYSQGVLCVLTCTSTLAAGVNLPAKRVILRAPYIGRGVMSRSQYKQMVGRAGRAGIDSSGESILIIKNTDKPKIGHLFSGSFDSCQSSLPYQGSKGLRTLFLCLLGLKLCKTKGDLESFLSRTLMAIQVGESFNLHEYTADALQALVSLGHIKDIEEGHEEAVIEVTPLGNATYKGCLDIDDTPTVYREIKRAMESMVLLNELHMLYLVTPLDQGSTVQPDWMTYQREVATLCPEEQKAANLIGVTDLYLLGRAYGRKISKCPVDEGVVRRFHLTLMLYKLMQGCSIWYVAGLFQVSRGFVQGLLTSSASYASCLVRFTEELSELWPVKLLLEAMMKKLSYTTNLELVPLMEVPGVKQARARQLFKAGYRTLSSLAWAEPSTLMDSIEHLPRRQAQQIISAAKMLLNEKADALREEAEDMVLVPTKASTDPPHQVTA